MLAPVWVHRISRKKAEEQVLFYLEKVKIPDQAGKYPGQLSSGGHSSTLLLPVRFA